MKSAHPRSWRRLTKLESSVRAAVYCEVARRGIYIRGNPLDGPLVPHKQCQWMGGLEIGPVCGSPSVEGHSYCEEHFAICYQPRVGRSKR